MFTEIEDSIALWERATSVMATALERHDAIAREAIAENSGHVFSTMGNGFAVSFDRCNAAASAAIDMQAALKDEDWPTEAEIRVRIGLHVGESFERDGDYFGPAVNTAARIMSAANSGQILASDLFSSLLGPGAHLEREPLGDHLLNGLVEPLSLVRIAGPGSGDSLDPVRTGAHYWESTEPMTAARSTGGHRIELFQRDGALRDLADAVENLRSGAPGFNVTLAAEAGGGKTTMVGELLNICSNAGVAAAKGGCDPIENPRPYGPLRDIALDRAAGLTGLDFAAGHRIDLLDRILLKLRSRTAPLVLIVEDLHWTDDASAEVLLFLARRIAELPVMLVLTYRPGEAADHPGLRGLIGETARQPGTVRPALEPLTLESVSTLIDGTDLDAPTVHRMTGGNPFFIGEVAAAGELLPGTVRDAIVARIGRLEPEVGELLGAIALAPRAMAFEALRVVLDVSAQQIDKAVNAGLLVIDGIALRFRHDLARQAVNSELSPLTAIELHRALAEELATREPANHSDLAHHAIGSHDSRLILDHVPAAAEDAYRAGATKESLPLLAIAIEHADRLGADERVDLRIAYARQLHFIDDLQQSIRVADEAVGIARSIGDVHTLSRALLAQGMRRVSRPDPDGARTSIDEAIHVLRDRPPTAELVDALHGSTMLHMFHRHHDHALREAEITNAAAIDLGDDARCTMAHNLLAIVDLATGDADRAVVSLRNRADEAAAAEDLHQLSHLLGLLGTGAGERRRYDAADIALQDAIELQDTYDLAAEGLYNRAWLSRIRFDHGRWSEAIEVGSSVLATMATGGGSTAMTATGAVGRAMVRQGNPAGIKLLRPILDHSPGHFLQYVWSPVCGLAEWHWFSGTPDRIEPIVAPLFARALEADSEWAKGELGFWMWRVGAIDEAPDGAASPFASHIVGDWEAASAAWERLGCPYEAAIAKLEGPSESKLSALAIFDRLGAKPAADLTRAQLRDEGIRPPRGPTEATRSNPVGLTARQREVLALMVEGCENGEIAARLFVSKKTVEHHVSAVFAKLGVDSRGSAITTAIRVGALDT